MINIVREYELAKSVGVAVFLLLAFGCESSYTPPPKQMLVPGSQARDSGYHAAQRWEGRIGSSYRRIQIGGQALWVELCAHSNMGVGIVQLHMRRKKPGLIDDMFHAAERMGTYELSKSGKSSITLDGRQYDFSWENLNFDPNGHGSYADFAIWLEE